MQSNLMHPADSKQRITGGAEQSESSARWQICDLVADGEAAIATLRPVASDGGVADGGLLLQPLL